MFFNRQFGQKGERDMEGKKARSEEEARESLAARKPLLVREEGSGVSHQENFTSRRIVSRRERMERPRAAGRGEMRW